MKYTKLTMTTTALVTTSTIITLGIYDLAAVAFGDGTSITVSDFLVNVGFNKPFVVFAIGFICGHLFGYMKPIKEIK